MFDVSCVSVKNGKGWIYSALLHVAGIVIAAQWGGTILTRPVQRHSATLLLMPSIPPAQNRPAPLPKPKLQVFKLPKPATLRDPVQTTAKANLPEAPAVQAAPAAAAVAPLSVPAPPPPQIQVKTGVLESQNLAAAPAKTVPSATVQPAGFDVLLRPRKEANEPNRVAPVGGFGGVSTAALPGTVKSTAAAGFGDTVLAKASPVLARSGTEQAQDSTPIEITFKPRPAYTDEARRAQIEGEVVVEANFMASGQVEVVRIVRGLPHGLNETAVSAVRAIRFHPARRRGQPVDLAATVRMNFELAY